MKRVIIYHNDADGKCSAAIAGRFRPEGYGRIDVEYIATDYADPVPWDRVQNLIYGEDEIWVVDFSYNDEEMFRLSVIVGESNFYWFDHHKTRKDLFEKYERFNGIRDVDHAACFLVWLFCNPRAVINSGVRFQPDFRPEIPWPVRYIADRDIWKFEYGSDTRAFYEMYLQEEDTHPNSQLWDRYFELYDAHPEALGDYLQFGHTLVNARRKQLKSIALRLGYETKLDGIPNNYRVLKINYPGSGDMGEVVREELGYDIAWLYCEKQKDVVGMVRENNLYSATVDVGEIAKAHGGGGHKGAAGFVEVLNE